MNRRRIPPGTPRLVWRTWREGRSDAACWWEWPDGSRSVSYASEVDARWWLREGLVWVDEAPSVQPGRRAEEDGGDAR